MNWIGTKVLITGAGGFIGSHLVEWLVESGAKVRAFVRYNSRNDIGLLGLLQQEILKEIEVIAGDLRDFNAVSQLASGMKFIFHLGALISIPYSYAHPREVIETNIIGTLNILVAGRDQGVGKIIHTSTSEVYGTAQYVPIDSNHPLQAQSPYAASKIGADKVAESFYRSFNLPIAIIRPFNTYGPRQSARAVIPTIITQALTQRQVRLGILDSTRDFTYVKDIVEGFIKVAESPKTIGEEVNIGSGTEISIGELTQRIISLLGNNAKIVVDPQRIRPPKSEVRRLCTDISKAKDMTGWAPRTSLDEGLKETIKWFSENIDRYRPTIYQI